MHADQFVRYLIALMLAGGAAVAIAQGHPLAITVLPLIAWCVRLRTNGADAPRGSATPPELS